MTNLRELAREITRQNIASTSSKENINDSLVRILYDGNRKVERSELINEITVDRLIAEHGEEELQKIATKDKAEYAKLVKATNKTVKNGLDTSWSRSQNNSSFHFNPKYDHLELHRRGDTFWITDAESSDDKAKAKSDDKTKAKSKK